MATNDPQESAKVVLAYLWLEPHASLGNPEIDRYRYSSQFEDEIIHANVATEAIQSN